jgi:pimeloyl-ACP methyl ester carboxylesterase
MRGTLETVTTTDGYILHGMVCADPDHGIWVIHVHGSYGNFYENFFLTPMAEAYASRGISFVSMNTRGHDYFADLKTRTDDGYASKRVGGIREIFRDCVHDIGAWARLARDRGAARVVLQGHSLGAMKVAYHAWKRPADANALVLISPPDSIGLQHNDVGDRYDEYLAHARSRAAVAPDELMPDDAYFDPISCAAYADLFAAPEETGMFTFGDVDVMRRSAMGAISIPILATFATEGEAVLDDLGTCADAIREVAPRADEVQVVVVDGANHNYHDREARLSECVVRFVDDTVADAGRLTARAGLR